MDCFNKECAWIHNNRCEYTFSAKERPSDCGKRLSHPPKPPKHLKEVKQRKKLVIAVHYWYKDWTSLTGYDRHIVYEYSKLHEMVEHVMDCGLYVMLMPNISGCTLAIDDRPFHSR